MDFFQITLLGYFVTALMLHPLALAGAHRWLGGRSRRQIDAATVVGWWWFALLAVLVWPLTLAAGAAVIVFSRLGLDDRLRGKSKD